MSDEVKKGLWVHKLSGNVYISLAIGTKMGADGPEAVYQLRSERFYYECNEQQFKEQFEKL